MPATGIARGMNGPAPDFVHTNGARLSRWRGSRAHGERRRRRPPRGPACDHPACMSVLSDRDIRSSIQAGEIVIRPYDPQDLQPSSVDLHLDRSFRVFRNNRYPYIDVRAPQPDLTEMLRVEDDEPFVLHPGEFVLGQTHEWVELPDDLVARLEGKALALDTPIPTPGGWRTMGDLRVGDHVFDESGAATEVVAATAPLLDRPCREITFSDGQRVVADADHQWVTVDKRGRRDGRQRIEVRTTEDIGRTLRVDGELN